MKYSHTRLISFTIGALAVGLSSVSADSHKPTVVTPPAVKDGSNSSRAPFPAARQFDDVKAPDGNAIDKTPPNTEATNVEPAVPPATITVLQPAPAAVVAAPAPVVVVAEPALAPTGRSAVMAASSLDAATFTPTIRSTMMSSRDQMIADIEMRMSNTEKAVDSLRGTKSQMSVEGRRHFSAADDEAKEKAKALKKSIKAAQKATDANWESARMQLAADYDAYAAALARMDAAVVVR